MYKTTLILILSFLVLSCAPVEGEKVSYDNACDASNDDKYVEVKGFLDDGGGLFCSNTSGRMECGFKFKKSLDQKDRGFSADVAISSGANSMDKADRGYTKSSLTVRGDNGERIDLEKEVTVIGEINSSKDPVSKELVCYMKVYPDQAVSR